MKRIFYFFFLLTLSSCSSENLGNDYYYLSADDALDIGFPYGSIIYKSNHRNVYQKIVIPANVIKCDVDGNYILVVQKPDSQLIKKQIKEYSRNTDPTALKSIFKGDTNYFIIDKSKETIDGPLTKAQFEYKKSQL